tara:strand:- start:5184 stop:5861 length:678 start_codon:yes stop_codon:yes gene_type:complete
MSRPGSLQLWGGLFVIFPIFFQAPWVQYQPISALAFTVVLALLSFYLGQDTSSKWFTLGSLMAGVTGSWLGGCLFWGWLRMYPVFHIPVESVVLPLAVLGLKTDWKIGASFYLSSLLGTGITDLTLLNAGIIDQWPKILNSSMEDARFLLLNIGEELLNVRAIISILFSMILITLIARFMQNRSDDSSITGKAWLVSSTVIKTTLLVDALFLLTVLIEPRLSGLI